MPAGPPALKLALHLPLQRSRAGWAGLIINAINCIPAGELDGARVYLGLCGRQANQRMGAGAEGVLPRWGGAVCGAGSASDCPERCCW